MLLRYEKKAAYSISDVQAFNDAEKIDEHFGFPYASVHSIAVNGRGLVNVHDNKQGERPRPHYFSNVCGIRYFKKMAPGCCIWDERYRWQTDSSGIKKEWGSAQADFIKVFGSDRIAVVRTLALERGLQLAIGLPDIAVFFPADNHWVFAELKRDEEPVRDEQLKWLSLLEELFGSDSVLILRFRKQYS